MGEGQVNEGSAEYPSIPAPVTEIGWREGFSALSPIYNDRGISQNVKGGYPHQLGNVQKSPKSYQFCFSVGTSSSPQCKLGGMRLV